MVYILLADGFEEIEAITPVDLLRRAGIEVNTVSITDDLAVTGGHDIVISADVLLRQINFDIMEMLVLPGGLGGVQAISECSAAMELITKTWNAEKKLAAICAAPTLLAKLDIIKGVSVVCYPSVANEIINAGGRVIHSRQVVVDGNLITGKSAAYSADFALELISALRSRETAEKISCAIMGSTYS